MKKKIETPEVYENIGIRMLSISLKELLSKDVTCLTERYPLETRMSVCKKTRSLDLRKGKKRKGNRKKKQAYGKKQWKGSVIDSFLRGKKVQDGATVA